MRPGESFVEQPIRSLQTMLRVLAEDDPKLPTVVPDGIYGPTTMHAVSTFQRQNGLPVTGITDQATWEAVVAQYELADIRINKAQSIPIYLNPGEIIKDGMSSPYVFLMQSMLNYLSQSAPAIQPPPNTGIMDAITMDALKNFQQAADIPVTGELDRLTWKHLVLHFSASAHHSIANQDIRE